MQISHSHHQIEQQIKAMKNTSSSGFSDLQQQHFHITYMTLNGIH